MNESPFASASQSASAPAHPRSKAWFACAWLLTGSTVLFGAGMISAELLWLPVHDLFAVTETSQGNRYPGVTRIEIDLPTSNISVVGNEASREVLIDREFTYAGARPQIIHGYSGYDDQQAGDPSNRATLPWTPDNPATLRIDLHCASSSAFAPLPRETCWADHAIETPSGTDLQITTSLGSIDVHGVDGELNLASTSRPFRQSQSLRESLSTRSRLFAGSPGTSALEGLIWVDEVSGPVTASSTYGSIFGTRLASLRVDVRIDSMRTVDLRFIAPPDWVSVETTHRIGGNVIVEVPRGDAYRIEIVYTPGSVPPPRSVSTYRLPPQPVPLHRGAQIQIDVDQDPDAPRTIRLVLSPNTRVHVRYANEADLEPRFDPGHPLFSCNTLSDVRSCTREYLEMPTAPPGFLPDTFILINEGASNYSIEDIANPSTWVASGEYMGFTTSTDLLGAELLFDHRPVRIVAAAHNGSTLSSTLSYGDFRLSIPAGEYGYIVRLESD